MPWLVISLISFSRWIGSTTTPLPIIESFFLTIPLGNNDNLNVFEFITSVWPALCPPWNLTTASAEDARRSTILPLPSSPHCVPTTTKLDIFNPKLALIYYL